MIKLELPEKPIQLSDEVQKALTELYKNESKNVWNKPFIRDAVLRISNSKCCYSECKLIEDSKYMEIDHFYPKIDFPEKVVEWGNLLPSCKKCNTSKGKHNPIIEPIINPCVDDPKEHLYIENFRYYAKTNKGKTTIDVVAINDRKHFVNKRYNIGIKILESLEDIKLNIEINVNVMDHDIPIRNRLMTKLKNLLREGTKDNEYSATISTVVLLSEDFIWIENILNQNSLWDNELDKLKSELEFCALIKNSVQ